VPLNPPPTIQADLGLVTQKITNSEVAHQALLTFALNCTGATSNQDTIDDFADNFNAQFGPLMANTCVIEKPTLLVGDGTTVPAFFLSAVAAGAGAVNGSYPPPNCAALFRKTTAFAGKKNRGRTYFPYLVVEGNVSNNGTIAGGELTTLQAAATAFLAQLTTDGTPMVIANKTLVVTPPQIRPHVTAITMGHAVTSYTVETMMATQRRRLRA
jgi:hypothetical protein